jgi:hypothetical protein
MASDRNATTGSKPFDECTIAQVWSKAQAELWFTFFKRDEFGATIAKQEYGKESEYGWAIDHIVPISKGGTDAVDNLKPVHWKNVGRGR